MNISKRQQSNFTKLVDKVNKALEKYGKRNPLLRGVKYTDKLPSNISAYQFGKLRSYMNKILQPGYSKTYSNHVRETIYNNYSKIFGPSSQLRSMFKKLTNKQIARMRQFPELRYLTYDYEWDVTKQQQIMDTVGLNEDDIMRLINEAKKV